MTRDQFYNGKTRSGKIQLKLRKQRRLSREIDFGVLWRGETDYPTYRLSWVEVTGELILVRLNEKQEFEILTIIPGEDNIRKMLAGWEDNFYLLNSIAWIKEKIA